jgi:hypothetical protein
VPSKIVPAVVEVRCRPLLELAERPWVVHAADRVRRLLLSSMSWAYESEMDGFFLGKARGAGTQLAFVIIEDLLA